MSDSASPLGGWCLSEILDTDSGTATADLYGKAFYHIRDHLLNFHRRLRLHGTDFSFLNVDAKELKDQALLKGKRFSRIEVCQNQSSMVLCSASFC